MKLEEIFESSEPVDDLVTKFANDHGIFDKRSIAALFNLTKHHGGHLDYMKKQDGQEVVMAGEKVMKFKDFVDLGKKLKNAIYIAKRDELLSSTRHIQEIEDDTLLAKIKEYVKDFNKKNAYGKLKLQIFNRPPNKQHAKPYKKIWLDGTTPAIAEFKKKFEETE